jgi:ribosome-associated protein
LGCSRRLECARSSEVSPASGLDGTTGNKGVHTLIIALKAEAAKTLASVPPAPVAEGAPDSGHLLNTILESLDNSKAEDIISIDIRQKSPLADHMVVASGRSDRHVGAIADHLMKALADAGFGHPRVEGLPNCDWVLVDAVDVIVHVFRPEVRAFYNLEKMWTPEPEPTKPARTRTTAKAAAESPKSDA